MGTLKKILLIEDEEDVRIGVREFLISSGYEILEAENGREGERQIMLHTPDMVILDLNLPGRGGQDVLNFVKKHKPTREIPIIILTGMGGITNRLSCMIKGASAYIHKPYENDELLKVVKRYI